MSFLASLPIIGSFFESAGKVVDDLVTSDEERLQVKAKIAELSAPVLLAVVQAQMSANELQARIVEAEAKSEDRLVRWRRPILSLLAAGNFMIVLWWWMLSGSVQNIFAITEIPAIVSYSFTFAALVNGLDIGTRGLEKMVGNWSNGHKNNNGNGKS
jgi:hypothetical protein